MLFRSYILFCLLSILHPESIHYPVFVVSSFHHLISVNSFCLFMYSNYTVLQLCFHWFLCRTDKDSKECCCQDNSYRISNLRRKSQTLFCTEEICHGNCTHECCRYRCDPVILLLAEQIHTCCPQNDHSKCLVCPAEVSPYDCIIQMSDKCSD